MVRVSSTSTRQTLPFSWLKRRHDAPSLGASRDGAGVHHHRGVEQCNAQAERSPSPCRRARTPRPRLCQHSRTPPSHGPGSHWSGSDADRLKPVPTWGMKERTTRVMSG